MTASAADLTRVPEPPASVRLKLGQPWHQTPDQGFHPAQADLSWSGDALHVTAELTDDQLFSQATADHQKMWELGDTFEMFFQIEGQVPYIELHVTPDNHRLHLALPGLGARPKTFEEQLVRPVGFESDVTRTPHGWRVSATLPPSLFGLKRFESSLRLRASFSRYDAAKDRPPVLSTTARHPKISFHHPDEWTPLVLE